MIKYPDYDRSILSIASSLLKHFGVTDCQHKTLPEFDKLLEKNYKNVIVILLDGLGTSTLNSTRIPSMPASTWSSRRLIISRRRLNASGFSPGLNTS